MVHGQVLKCFNFLFTHGVVGTVIIGDHGAPCGALVCLVATALASETLDGTCLGGSILGVVDGEALDL